MKKIFKEYNNTSKKRISKPRTSTTRRKRTTKNAGNIKVNININFSNLIFYPLKLTWKDRFECIHKDISKKLYEKYNVSAIKYSKFQINDLIFNKNTRLVLSFKENLLFNDLSKEYIRYQYDKGRSLTQLKTFCEIFNEYFAILINPTFSNLKINDLMNNMIIQKVNLNYGTKILKKIKDEINLNKGINIEDSENDNKSNINNNESSKDIIIFNSLIKKNILSEEDSFSNISIITKNAALKESLYSYSTNNLSFINLVNTLKTNNKKINNRNNYIYPSGFKNLSLNNKNNNNLQSSNTESFNTYYKSNNIYQTLTNKTIYKLKVQEMDTITINRKSKRPKIKRRSVCNNCIFSKESFINKYKEILFRTDKPQLDNKRKRQIRYSIINKKQINNNIKNIKNINQTYRNNESNYNTINQTARMQKKNNIFNSGLCTEFNDKTEFKTINVINLKLRRQSLTVGNRNKSTKSKNNKQIMKTICFDNTEYKYKKYKFIKQKISNKNEDKIVINKERSKSLRKKINMGNEHKLNNIKFVNKLGNLFPKKN